MLDRWVDVGVGGAPPARLMISDMPTSLLVAVEAQLRTGLAANSGEQGCTIEQMLDRISIEYVVRAMAGGSNGKG